MSQMQISRTNDSAQDVPVSVLVGFLGAGKTTTLNRLPRGVHGKKIAVVVNEFGEIDVDSQVVTRETRADAELVSLANECICCKLRGDLLGAVEDLTQRHDLDYILVESTGLGEAAPIAQTFYAPSLEGKVKLDAVITVVDAAHFWDTYEDPHAEGKIAGESHSHSVAHLLAGQIEFADVVLLNKTDLVPEDEVRRLETFLRELNDRAKIIRTRFGEVDPAKLLYTGAFDLNQAGETEEWQEAEEELEHVLAEREGDEDHREEGEDHDDHESEDDGYGFASYVYATRRPFDLDALRRQVFSRWHQVAAGVARSKGTVNVAGSDDVLLWNQAGRRVSLEVLGRWREDSQRGTQVVLIGRGLDTDALSEALEACTLPEDQPAPAVASPVSPAGRREEIVLGVAP